MEPKELSLRNSNIIDESLEMVHAIVTNEKLTIANRVTQLTDQLEVDENGICKSSKHNHKILGQCVGLCRSGNKKVVKQIGDQYQIGVDKMNENIEKYAGWLKASR